MLLSRVTYRHNLTFSVRLMYVKRHRGGKFIRHQVPLGGWRA